MPLDFIWPSLTAEHMVIIITPPLKGGYPTTNNLTPSRTCPCGHGFAGKPRAPQLSLAEATSRSSLLGENYIIFSPAYLSTCFMVYSCGEKHLGVGWDLFSFLMFLLGWINTFFRNETSGDAGNLGTWVHLSNASSTMPDPHSEQ